jgi:ATP-dependent helicase/nuclease subunit A
VAPVTEELFADFAQRVITHAPHGWHAASGAAFETLEERHEAAEEKRLAYVAATRAERLLVVSTYHDRDGERRDGPWQDLNPHLTDDIPLLSSPEPSETAPQEAPAPRLSRHADRRSDALARASEPSYREHGVSDDHDAGASLSEEEGHGPVFGTAVHTLLEQVVAAGRSDDTISMRDARRALRRAHQEHDEAEPDELPDARVRAAKAQVDRFFRHSFSTEIADAPEVYTEYPFAEASPADGEPTDVLRGTIDLVFRDDRGWHVIDYKTDPIDEVRVEDFPPDHPYARQVQRYAEVWADLTGEPVGRTGLWFTGLPVLVDLSDA